MTTVSEQESLWIATAPASTYPALAGEVAVDVGVVGGGIAGLTTALLLKRNGARVAVLEAARLGQGVTGCTTAKVTALQQTLLSSIRSRHGAGGAAAYAQASLAGVEKLAAITTEEGTECDLERRPAATYAANNGQLGAVEQEFDTARAAGLPVEWAEGLALPYSISGAVRLDGQIQIRSSTSRGSRVRWTARAVRCRRITCPASPAPPATPNSFLVVGRARGRGSVRVRGRVESSWAALVGSR
jgi:glycine/D-amino acid oxidase-like deaminating enzyme